MQKPVNLKEKPLAGFTVKSIDSLPPLTEILVNFGEIIRDTRHLKNVSQALVAKAATKLTGVYVSQNAVHRVEHGKKVHLLAFLAISRTLDVLVSVASRESNSVVFGDGEIRPLQLSSEIGVLNRSTLFVIFGFGFLLGVLFYFISVTFSQ